MDGPSPLGSEGLPFVLDCFEVNGRTHHGNAFGQHGDAVSKLVPTIIAALKTPFAPVLAMQARAVS
jgi:hypothetical protein